MLIPALSLRSLQRMSLRNTSLLQIPFFEFLRSGAERAQLVDGRAYRREGERRKRFGEHLVEVFPRGDAGADVRIEVIAGHLRHERRNILDHECVEGWVVVPIDERGYCSGVHREWGRSGDQVRLQLEQFGGRPNDNAGNADVVGWGVVVLERLQLHAVHVGAGENLVGRSIDLLEIRRPNETLNQCDMRTMRRIQGESFWENLEQAGI